MRDAETLLRGVVPPTGAIVRSSGTAIGAHAHLLTSALASAVAYRTWTVPGDAPSVLSFVQAHLSPGSKLVGSGSGGPTLTESVTLGWPAVDGVLALRWLEIQVTARAHQTTALSAESQSQWVLTRPRAEHLPADIHEVDITDAWPGKAPFISRRVTDRADVGAVVALFNSLGIVQPDAVNCPGETVTPTVEVQFRAAAAAPPVARVTVSASANFRFPASLPGATCFAITFKLGRAWPPLVGNVIAPLGRLLHVQLNPAH